jgi:hypothetical protein
VTTPEADPDRLAALAQQALSLAQEYTALAEASGDQFVDLAKRARRSRLQIRILWVLVALVLALAGGLAGAVVGVVNNDHRISVLTHRLDVQQTVTRRNSLCPLYTLLLASETPAARAAAPDKAAYDHAAMVIRAGYDALKCSDFVAVPPTAAP